MNKTKFLSLLFAIVGIVALGIFAVPRADAIVGNVIAQPATATATTTRSYMTPGTATTTYDFAYSDSVGTTLLVQFTASTSAAYLGWNYQYSMNGIDFYSESSYQNTAAATGDTHLFASTSPANLISPNSSTASTTSFLVSVPDFPARIVRVQFYIPTGKGSTNGAVWAQAVKKGN